MSVAIKYKAPRQITQVPIFISSKFPSSEQFRVRINLQQWSPAPFLKYVNNRRFHPIAIEDWKCKIENHFQTEFSMYYLA